MIGSVGARSLLAARLAAALPAKTAELRTRHALAPTDLPDISRVWATPAPDARSIGVEQWPLMELVPVTDDPTVEDQDGDPAAEKAWIAPYASALYIRARGTTYEATDRARGLYVVAAVEIIRDQLVLSTDPGVRIDSGSLRVDYSTVDSDDARTIAGVRIQYMTWVRESITATVPLVESVSVDTTLIPRP